MRYMGRSGLSRAGIAGVLGAVMLGGFFASPASAHANSDFHDKDYTVTLVAPTPTYDAGTNQTTIRFTLEGTEQASHITIVPCGSPTVVSAKGPDGKGPETTGPDPSTEHSGTKFTGLIGEYEIVYQGNVPGLEVIVKNGPGHKHFGLKACTTETTTPSTPTEQTPPSTPTEQTPPSTPTEQTPPNNPPQTPQAPQDNPPASPAANLPSQSGTQVADNTETKPGADVLSDKLTAPEALATLPRTGLPVPALASIGTMLLALGGLATALGRWPRR